MKKTIEQIILLLGAALLMLLFQNFTPNTKSTEKKKSKVEFNEMIESTHEEAQGLQKNFQQQERPDRLDNKGLVKRGEHRPRVRIDGTEEVISVDSKFEFSDSEKVRNPASKKSRDKQLEQELNSLGE